MVMPLRREDRNLLLLPNPTPAGAHRPSWEQPQVTPELCQQLKEEVQSSDFSVVTGHWYYILEPPLEVEQVILKNFSQKISPLCCIKINVIINVEKSASGKNTS